MATTVLFALVVLSLLVSLGTYFAVKLAILRIESTEQAVLRRLEQLQAMQYNIMRKQGWTHEELSEAFPALGNPDVRVSTGT